MTQNEFISKVVEVAEDASADPRFLAAEASIFTSDTPSNTPCCCSSVDKMARIN